MVKHTNLNHLKDLEIIEIEIELNKLFLFKDKLTQQIFPIEFGRVKVSMQASEYHYSTPRDNVSTYSEVELGFPNIEPPDYIFEFAENPSDLLNTVYAYVPLGNVARWIKEELNN